MNTATYNRREKDLTCAACTLADAMKTCPVCAFYDSERNNKHVPTVLEIRTVLDTDGRQWRVADVMDFGAILPHSVVLYEIIDKVPAAALPHSFREMTACDDYDTTPKQDMPTINFDDIQEIEY